MTYKEAIKALEKELLYNLGTEKAEAYRMAIKAMKEQNEKEKAVKYALDVAGKMFGKD